jgi:hypothetical protein
VRRASFALLFGALLFGAGLAACDGGGPRLPDAGCGEPGAAPDQPALSCPAEVDLGCIGDEGAPIALDVRAASCDGSPVTVTCTPENGALVRPGTTQGRCEAMAPSGARAECTFAIRNRVSGAPRIACGEPVRASCTGVRTAVPVTPAVVMPSCEGPTPSAPTSDAPAGGFPVGTTRVTWSADVPGGSALSCAVEVRVEDATPPSLDCASAPTRVVRTSPDAPIAIAAPSASDGCDDDVEVTLAPMPTERGEHRVTATARDEAGLVSTCDFTVRVLDVFAPRELRIVSATLRGDGATDVTLGWSPSEGADVTAVRIERAASETGPWTALGTVGASTLTFTDASMPGPRAYYRLVALAGDVEGGATAPVRALAVEAREYHLRDQSVSSVPFATSLFGVVRHPVTSELGVEGPAPLVVFLHGNHGNCRPADGSEDACVTLTAHDCTEPGFSTTPNAQGYLYLQDTLAAQGYVTVSLSANALNCRDDYIPQRTQLVLEHLRRWAAWSTAASGPFGGAFVGRVDLGRVSLVGHSRGGEAVAAAPAALAATPIAGVTLASVLAIGPTDFRDPRPSGVAFSVLLPGCDADVRTLEGLLHYDRGLDPTDANVRSQLLFVGANHNFFNREWRFDDNDGFAGVCSDAVQVGAPAQRGMLEVFLSDWVGASTAETRLPAYVRAEADTPALMSAWAGGPLDLRWSYAAAMRRVIDDFRGTGAPNTNDTGGANTYSGFIAELVCTGTCARNFPHAVGGIRPAWDDAAASAQWSVGSLDASVYDVLSMRFATRLATINEGVVEHDFAVRVRDAAGVSAELPVSRVGRVPNGYPSNAEQEILGTVRVPLRAFVAEAPTLDLTRLTRIELAMPIAGGNPQGSIWVADVDLASD